MDTLLKYQWLLLPLFVFTSFLVRYSSIAGFMYWVLYRWKKDTFRPRKNQPKYPEPWQLRYELKWSLSSSAVMGIVGTIVFYAYQSGNTLVYANISDRGWGYYFLSIFIMLCLHDAYFYWVHRLLHSKLLWRIHRLHHHVRNPTPWSSFCMHPIEMALEGGVVAPMLFIVPAHVSAFVFFAFFILLNAIYGHSGFELFRPGFSSSRWLRWINTQTFHNMHHSRVGHNFGLYTNIWDRVFGTVHGKYDEEFEGVAARRLARVNPRGPSVEQPATISS